MLSHQKMTKSALIIGAGPGISFSFAKALVAEGYAVAMASRDLQKLKPLAESIGALAFRVDTHSIEGIQQLFTIVETAMGGPEVVLFNPSARIKGDILSVDPSQLSASLQAIAVGAFTSAQEAAKRMIPKQRGALFFTGATASVKGFARSSVFAMEKFAVRGLAQSLARELSPLGIHVAHFVIDGAVRSDLSHEGLNPDAVAQTYMATLLQPKQAWSWEIEIRSFNENF
jgi:NAD(P)-dependent dehydrogenase (short-subunit alcohol dehydrogenase family)